MSGTLLTLAVAVDFILEGYEPHPHIKAAVAV